MGEVPPLSITFPKPAYIYQPQLLPPVKVSHQQVPEALKQGTDSPGKHVPRAQSKEVFEYDDVPEEVLQWAFSLNVQIATIH